MTEMMDLADLAGLPELEVPEAWRGPAPTDAAEIERRLDGLRGDVVRDIGAGRLCPVMGAAAAGHLDEIRERGVADLLASGDDVFGRLRTLAAGCAVMRPLPGFDFGGIDETLAVLERYRDAGEAPAP